MTTTALSRWSCTPTSLPDAARISQVNIFDFDNTLFRTPLPSRFVWEGPTIGFLQSQDALTGGGWWHDPQLLSSIGGGIDKMEPTAWKGWWQEDIVTSARESIATPGHLTVLMTGRSQTGFSELVARIVKAKGLQFDMVVLKPDVTPGGEIVSGTVMFKNQFFKSVMTTYGNANRLVIYEDRAKQANAFTTFLDEWNSTLKASMPPPSRSSFDFHIELVEPASTAFDPQHEIAQVKRMINGSNASIAFGKASDKTRPYTFQTVRKYTGYLIAPLYATKLKGLLVPPDPVEPEDIRPLADSIMLSFDPPRRDILSRAGGTGAKQEWRTVAVGNNKNMIWAVRVEPVDRSRPHPTERNPMVILGHLPRIKTSEARYIKSWAPIPPEEQIVFPTEVGDRALVRIVEDRNSDLATNTHTANAPAGPRRDQRRIHQPREYQSSADDSETMDVDQFPPLGHGNNSHPQHAPRGRGRGASAYAANRGRDRQGPYPQVGRGNHANAANGRGRQSGPGGGPGGGGNRGNARGGRGGRGGQYRSLDDAGSHGYGGSEGMQY